MDYFKLQVTCDESLTEILIAQLSILPFDTFEENENGFEAYIPKNEWSAEVEGYLQGLQGRFVFSFEKSLIPAQNWNAVWESNFHPVVVDDFCGIRADFHPPLQHVEHELVINPKMAFGTGHHETTFMVIQLMRHIPLEDTTVLDYGCGTGILAILASKLGATFADAIDIEKEACENVVENSTVNGVKNVRVLCGGLEILRDKTYDVVLANINRNVILQSLPSLSKMVKHEGRLVVSGFVQEDEALMEHTLREHGFQIIETSRRNNWLAIHCKRQ